jgi:hypothetical protein
MAVTVNSGLVATDDPLAASLGVDMREKITNLDTDTTQFSTMLMRLPTERAKSFKIEWMDDQLLPKYSALAASAASDVTNLVTTTDEGSYFKAGDVIRNADTGEPMRVTGVAASSLTVVRAIDGSTALSTATAAKIVHIGGTNEQGAEAPTALIAERTANYNYTQIVRNPYRFTETLLSTSTWYGGPQDAIERRKKAVEHKWEIENSLFFGARSYSAGTTAPRTSSGGLLQFVTSESDTDTLDKTEIQTFLRNGLEYGSNRKVFFCSPLVAQVISGFLSDNWVQATPNDKVWGVQVSALISGVSGARIPIVVKSEWKRYGESAGQYGTYGVLVDMDNVAFAPLRDTRLLGNRQNPSADEKMAEYLTEYSLRVSNASSMRWLVDVTGGA